MTVEVLFDLFKKLEEQKKAILLVGKYGIGKSSIVYEYGRRRAKELGRELRVWHEMSEKEKKEVIENPAKYYVIVDIKGSMISPENLIMPFLVNGELVWKVPLWVKVFEKPESAGILFIDEINMTPAKLQSILFELILQRKIGETALKSKNLLIVGAGNDLESNEYANEIPKPLLNRFLVLNADEILLSVDYWIIWAKENGIDERIIHYVLYKNRLFTKAEESLKQSTTPRSLHMLSDLIKGVNDLQYIEFVAKMLLEEHDALEFVEFIRLYEKLRDLSKYLENPKLLRKLNEDELFMVTMKITEWFLDGKIDVEKYHDFLEEVANIRGEYSLTAIKYIKNIVRDSEKWKKFSTVIVQKKGKLYRQLHDLLEFYT